MHVLIDVDASVSLGIGVDATLEVYPFPLLRVTDGPPAALDRHRDRCWLLKERVQVLENGTCLLEAQAMAHDHMTAQQKHCSLLNGVVCTSLEDEFLSGVLVIQSRKNFMKLKYVSNAWGETGCCGKSRRLCCNRSIHSNLTQNMHFRD
jgi:hypothetical protein